MAAKPRTPMPPRQGPKRREDPRQRPNSRLLLIGAAAVVGLLVLIAGVVLLSGDDKAGTAAAGCQFKTLAELPAGHVEKLPAGYKYNSTPPTSGLHRPVTTFWNFYEEPTANIHNVHNLEHGGIVVSYDQALVPAQVQELREWWQADPNGVVVTPRVGQKGVVAAAWTHLLTCENLNTEALSDFRDDWRGKGPEQFPIDALLPGQN